VADAQRPLNLSLTRIQRRRSNYLRKKLFGDKPEKLAKWEKLF